MQDEPLLVEDVEYRRGHMRVPTPASLPAHGRLPDHREMVVRPQLHGYAQQV